MNHIIDFFVLNAFFDERILISVSPDQKSHSMIMDVLSNINDFPYIIDTPYRSCVDDFVNLIILQIRIINGELFSVFIKYFQIDPVVDIQELAA